jgi:hypothetical protein
VETTIEQGAPGNLQVEPEVAYLALAHLTPAYPEKVLKYLVK